MSIQSSREKWGKYFALAQGFDEEVANAVSDHYLPTGNASIVAKKPISYTISIVDKLDTLVGFFNKSKTYKF